MSRLTTRLFLGASLLLALGVIVLVVRDAGTNAVSTGAALAGALAVVTAVVAAWGAQRVVELEEDRQKPFPYPSLDFTSSYSLVLFRIDNLGGGPAHDIKIDWNGIPLHIDGEPVHFTGATEEADVPILLPGKFISMIIDGHGFFEGNTLHRYQGTIRFRDASGRAYSHKFTMDAEPYRGTPLHPEEALRTHYELQKIPSHLEKVERQLQSISRQINQLADKQSDAKNKT